MSKHYGLTRLNEVADGDEDFLKKLAEAFFHEIHLDLKSLEEAIDNENKDLAYQFAHKMKPNIKMFDIKLDKELTKIESWTKNSKRKKTVLPQLEVVRATLDLVFNELKEDFQL